ncbi:MAG: hypothetical protein LBG47_10490 [Prevotellaceae bacterium]|jgi:hypothetical protein|nr:hypothetical protein [Prevotellaceae bacterium]
MATAIKPAPVLTGKASENFYRSLAKAKESKSKEEVRTIARNVRAFLAKQDKNNGFNK